MPDPEQDRPVLDMLAAMTTESLERSTLANDDLMLVRLAALVAMDAPPVSYLLNMGAASDAGIDGETLEAVLIAIAPIVGTARIGSAASKITRALGIAIAIADDDAAPDA